MEESHKSGKTEEDRIVKFNFAFSVPQGCEVTFDVTLSEVDPHVEDILKLICEIRNDPKYKFVTA